VFRIPLILAAALFAASSVPETSAQTTDLRAIFSAPITVERTEPVAVIPVEQTLGKLYIEAVVNGTEGRFIFDTGSPTIVSRAFAESLDLEVVGQNTGVDANGNAVTMDIAIARTIALGSTVFRDVPVLIHDFSGLTLGSCFIRDGVIGSEIFPGSAWRIDLERSEISLAASRESLGGDAPWLEARLYDFGYPHAPIVDYVVADISDKALFDTGSDEVVVLFAEVAANASVRAAMNAETVSRGRGTEGESAGGRGAIVDIHRFTLDEFAVGETAAGPRSGTTRSVPPSLIGARWLETDIVTLDYPGNAFLLEARSEPEAGRQRGGYSIAYSDGHGEVVQLFDNSPAAASGLQLGDHVVEISGHSLVPSSDAEACDIATWLAEGFEPVEAADLVIERDGERIPVHVPRREP
jgi:hypothetical protein